MITLYDFASRLPGRTLSPYVWRVRIALNIKGLAHKTEWLEYSKLESLMKERGIPPSEVLPDGQGRYTVPALFDSSTNTTISDSSRILKYLDEAYPDTHNLCTLADPNDEFIKPAFEPGWRIAGAKEYSLWALLVPTIVAHFDGDSAVKYEGNLRAVFNMGVEQFLSNKEKQDECWKDALEAYEVMGSWIEEAKERYGSNDWILGKDIKLPDLAFVTTVAWVALFAGEEHEMWKKLVKLNGGKWGVWLERIKPYTTVY